MKRIILSIMMCCLIAAGGYAQEDNVTDITVEREGQLGYKVLEVYDSFLDVTGLRITGPINDEDWKTLKEMTNLRYLYMENAITYDMPAEQFSNSKLVTVELPITLLTIGDSGFRYSYYLKSVNMPNVSSIGNSAFSYCSTLTIADMPNVSSIEYDAFEQCSALTTADMPNVSYIGYGAFRSCSKLNSVNLPNITSIGQSAFKGCSGLTSATLSDKLTTLGAQCFSGCSSLTSLVLPASIIDIPDGVFDNCNRIRLIECNAPVPPSVGTFPFANEVIYAATLRVQSASLASYQADPFWSRFSYWEESPTRITDLILNRNLILNDDVRLDKLHLTINPGAALIINGNTMQEFKSVTLVADDTGCGVFMSNSNAVVSDATKIVYNMKPGKWYYTVLPFSTDMSAIEVTDNALLAIYDYDGETRAANGTGGSWHRITEGTLQAGRGYIIQASKATTMTFNAGYSVLNDAFTPYALSTPLNEWPSELGAPEAGWNFVGNPYPTYFDIRYMDFSAPVTVWTGTTYAAYSVADDELALAPLQPFFVQCPEGVSNITFNVAGRQTTAAIDHSIAQMPQRRTASARQIVNLTLSTAGGSENDRTRIVVNTDATDGYEMSCDAAKMMSTDPDVAQLWTARDGISYAINEGPQADGRVSLNLYIPANGEYTIAATRADISATLYDSLTGRETQLSGSETYTFAAESGTVSGRFFIVLGNGTTGIGSAATDGSGSQQTTYYTVDGRTAGTDAATLSPGVYVKKNNGKAVKVIIR